MLTMRYGSISGPLCYIDTYLWLFCVGRGAVSLWFQEDPWLIDERGADFFRFLLRFLHWRVYAYNQNFYQSQIGVRSVWIFEPVTAFSPTLLFTFNNIFDNCNYVFDHFFITSTAVPMFYFCCCPQYLRIICTVVT